MSRNTAWYPACKVRFQIRIEDFEDDVPLPDVITSSDKDGGSEAFGLGQEHQAGAEFKSIGYDIVPFTAVVERNSYREADSFRVSIPFSRMPFDPRVIRSATCQIFMGSHSPKEYGVSMQNPGAEGILLRDNREDGVSNEVVRGFVDEWKIVLPEDGTNSLEITGRDLTSFLIDAELPENSLRGIPKNTRLDEVIRAILFGDDELSVFQLPDVVSALALPDVAVPSTTGRPGLPGVKGLKVVNDTGEPLPSLGDYRPPNWFDSKNTTRKGRKRSPRSIQRITYWDMITDLCVSAGFIVYIRQAQPSDPPTLDINRLAAAELVISNPRTYYKKATRFGEEIVAPSTVRTFHYGLNTNHVEISRNYIGDKVPSVVEVRSFDGTVGKTIRGRFPKEKRKNSRKTKKNNRPATSGKGDREEIDVYTVRGVSGPMAEEILNRMAASIYEQLGRPEFEIKIKTKDLAALPSALVDFGERDQIDRPFIRGPVAADIFQLGEGDPIIFKADQAIESDGRISSYTSFLSKTEAGRSKEMEFAGIRNDVAESVSLAYSSQHIQEEFRVKRVQFNFQHQTGFDIVVDAINFLDVRNAIENGE